jgi:hypothetical protein
LVVPDKNCTFDHLRPVTSFEHIVNDFLCNIAEDDLTRLKEVLYSDLLERALRYTGFEVLARDYCPPFHLFSIASKA